MPLELGVQFDIIIYGMLAGVLIGILFDIYRVIRGADVPVLVKIIEDILFSILTAIVVFIFLLYNNYAFLGVYVYLFIGVALVIYFKIISKYFVNIENKIGKKTISIVRRTSKIVIYPFKLLLSKMGMKNK